MGTAGGRTLPIYLDPSNDTISYSSLDAFNDYICEQRSRLNPRVSSTRQFALVKLLLSGG
jgi:hypothetical protein